MQIAYADLCIDHADMTELRDVLRRRRDDLSLTQPEVASALGVTANQLSRWESGFTAKIPAEAAIRMMFLYDLAVADVIEEIGLPASEDPVRAVRTKVAEKQAIRAAADAEAVARSESGAPRRGNRGAR